MAVFRKFLDRTRVALEVTTLSLTKQAMRDECNINRIMDRYQKTGLLDHVQQYAGKYGDFAGVQDYQSSVNQVLEAQEAFMTLPSSVRKRFDNDPGAFLEFVMDASNLEEMVSLGLANPPPPANDAGEASASPGASVAP